MARLIFFVYVVVALSGAFAAPLAEEKDNAQQAFQKIESLLKSADPEENDIAKPVEVTDSTAEVPTPSSAKDDSAVEAVKEPVQAITEEEVAVQVTPTSASLVDGVPSEESALEHEFADTIEEIIEKYGETEDVPQVSETPSETVEKVEEISSNATKQTDVKITTEQEVALIPVTEIIPPPKKIFVLGEYADEEVLTEPASENTDDYKIFLGETEDVIPFLSEYQPDTLSHDQEEFSDDAPLVEQVEYEYPQEPIMPGAEYRPFQGPMADHSDVMYDDYNPGDTPGPHMDYGSDYDVTSPDYGVDHDYFSGMNSPSDSTDTQMSDYPTESHLGGKLDYADDFHPMQFGKSHDYDADTGPNEDDHMMQGDVDSMSALPMHDDLKASIATQLGNFPDSIVAGLHENYHPEPISGMIPFPTEFSDDNSDSSYSTTDDPIRPSAMVNFDSPAVENTHPEDEMMGTPMPETPSMLDLPRPVAEFPINNQPMASMQPLDPDNMSLVDDNLVNINEDDLNDYEVAELAGRPTQQTNEEEVSTNDVGKDSQPDVVIELDISNQQALVNGKPFVLERPTSILGFISQILEATRDRSRVPSSNNYFPERQPFNYYYDDGMNFPMRDQYSSSNMYPSSYGDDAQSEQYQPSSYEYDYLPYNYFLSALRRRLLQARFNKMRSFGGGYGYDYMGGYNPVQGYNSIRGYDDSMSGYTPIQEYGPMQGYGVNGRSLDSYNYW